MIHLTNSTRVVVRSVVTAVLCVLILVIFVFFGGMFYRYVTAARLCCEIKDGKAIETHLADATSAPVFMRSIFTIMQLDIVKIPLVEACYWGNVQAVETLLHNGANPNYSLRGYWTPIEAAVNGTASKEECKKIIKLLVEHGANIDQYESTEPVLFTFAGRLTLTNDADHEHEMILWLLDNGANPKESIDNQTILHYAARGTDSHFVATLINDYQFDVNSKGYDGQTPLIAALRYNNPCATPEQLLDMIHTLVSAGADVSITDENGKTAYDYAIQKGLDDIANILNQYNQ